MKACLFGNMYCLRPLSSALFGDTCGLKKWKKNEKKVFFWGGGGLGKTKDVGGRTWVIKSSLSQTIMNIYVFDVWKMEIIMRF